MDFHRWFAEGLRRQGAGDFPGAVMAWRQVLRMDPAQADAWCNLGGCLRELRRLDEAQAALRRALEVQPDNLAAQCNLGVLAMDAGQSAEALEIFESVLKRDPDCYPARFHLGGVLVALERWDEALEAAEEAARRGPDYVAAHANLGWHHMKGARFEAAEGALARALELDPENPSARWNRAYVRLLQGRWRDAWPDFRHRLRLLQGLPNQRHLAQPLWGGETFPGQTLLLWFEQGYGDTVQFVRLLPEVRARGGRVVVQVQGALKPLMPQLPGADQVVAEGEPLPPFDLQAPLMDLPCILDLAPDTLRDCIPYLALPEGYRPPEVLRAVLEGEPRTRIGLAWTGNPTHKDQARRSIPPSCFAPLAALPGVAWFSVQKFMEGTLPEALPSTLKAVDLGPALATFADTAWALGQLDLLICADVGVAHLAGALGLPVLLLLPSSPDWRWGQEGDTTPWYPTFRIYRQARAGDWDTVIQKVLGDLLGR